jgi:hypothetical protein
VARELFVYWKLQPDALGPALQAAAAMQAALRLRHPGLQARLMRRADDTGPLATLMETYAQPPAGLSAELQRDIASTAATQLGAWCQGQRHVELFELLDS